MPIYEVQANGKTFEVEAPSLRAAITAVNRMAPAAPGQHQMLRPEDFTDQPQAPEGSAIGRFGSNLGEMLNPVTIAQGLYQTVRHPIETGEALLLAQSEQFGKAGEALTRMGQAPGFLGKAAAASEALGHGVAGALPIVGPVAAEAGEQIGSGDIAGGLGKATGVLGPAVGTGALVRGARAALPQGGRQAVAAGLEKRAAKRVADVMSPKVGANKVRIGGQAEKVTPQIAKDLAKEGAPLTREGFHAQIQGKLHEAEAALDTAANARNANAVIHTRPIIRALEQKRTELTAQTHRLGRMKAGEDVVPAPNAARVAQINQAISEIERLGPVANYEALRQIRHAYDGPAKAVYAPSVTADYLKAQGGKLGAADVTGTLRETLARMDPQTAAANAQYSLYRTADDALKAVAEVERTRPRVGRAIMARLTGVVFGGQKGGAAGAAAGYVAGPILDQALASGATTQLKTAAALQRLANAVRAADMERVNGALALLKRELKTTALVQSERSTGRRDMQPAPAMP